MPFSAGRGGRRLIRRQCGASIPHHTTSNNSHPSRQTVSHPSIHRRHHVPVQSHGYLGSRWASAAPVGLPATRLKSARRGRRWPPPSGEMPATLSLRNSPREEAPLAFPGHTALRRKSPKLKLTTFFSVEAPCFTSTVPSPPRTKVAREGDPCALLQPNQLGQPGHEEPLTRPRPPHWNGAEHGPRRRLLSSKHTHLHLRGIFFATILFGDIVAERGCQGNAMV